MGEQYTSEQRVSLLELELKQLKAENAVLRNRVRENNRHVRRVGQAYDDGLLLAGLHIAYQPHSRDASPLTRRRWDNAVGLLRLARVYNCKRFTCHNLAEIETALNRAKQIATDNPTAYLARMPSFANDRIYRHG